MYSYTVPFYYNYPIQEPIQMPIQNPYMTYYFPQQNFFQGLQNQKGPFQTNICPSSNIQEPIEQQQGQNIEKDPFHSKKKRNCIQNRRERDEEFRQRQQTANRNLCSNTLKVYLKQARDKNSETFRSICRTIQIYGLEITAQQYINTLDSQFAGNRTYVSFEKLKKMSGRDKNQRKKNSFGIVLRTTFKRFFLHEIHMVCIKSVRTTRKIRNQQIKQGRIFLKEIIN